MIGRDTFSALAPVLHPQPKKLATLLSSTVVHGGQHDTEYVTFELLLHAPFVADKIWGFMLEPARTVRAFSFTLRTVQHFLPSSARVEHAHP